MIILDDIKKIKSIDKSRMLRQLNEFPRQCREALDIGSRFSAKINLKEINKIVFAGMGGSAIGADLVKSYLARESRLPIVVVRDYFLPRYVDQKSLVFITSYSGNTEETISAYTQARAKRAKIIIICSGGKLLAEAKGKGIPYVVIPSNLIPRAALGYLSIAPLVILSKIGLVKHQSKPIKETAKALEGLRDNSLGIGIKQNKNIAKQIAKRLFGKFMIIYAAIDILEAAVTRFRGQLAENSKTLSWSHIFPEMNHNEIVGWQHPKDLFKHLSVVFLKDKDDYYRTKSRMDVTKKILKDEGVQIIDINTQGKSLLSRIFSLIYICDFVSFYLAIINKTDPTPVDKVTYLKQQLSKLK